MTSPKTRAWQRAAGWPLVIGLVSGLAFSAPALGAPNHPFGSHPMPYASGAILPSHVNQATLDQAVKTFYDGWKDEYVEQTCGTGRYVVRTSTSGSNLTVSEGHGYGMMIAALMAGHDPDAQTVFDGMYAYFREHPTSSHDNLMAWFQNQSCQDANGTNSATDGDLDIAFALLLADKQWGSCGSIDYLAEAQSVIADIKDGDLDNSASYTLLGDWVTPSSTQYYPSTRPSDFMLDHFRSYAAATGDSAWNGLVDDIYAIIEDLQTEHAATTGLLPDFALNPATEPVPANAGFLEGANDGAYNYNACRTPWRIATDYLVSGDARARTAAQRITTWIKTSTGGNPNSIKSGYALSGAPLPNSNYLSMAFIAPFGVGAMVDDDNQAWLNAVWDRVVTTPLSAEGYYENTLKLLGMIVMSGNWWAPQAVSGGCAPTGTPLCPNNPGVISGVDFKVARLGAPLGDEAMKLKGKMFFPGGIPVTSLDGGAQILVEDLGAGGSAVFELTTDTTPIPSAAAGACDPKDAWKVSPKKTGYRNRSTALDPPTCTAGSANGLNKLGYRTRSELDLDVTASTKRSSISTPTGPIRLTLVLGDSEAAAAAGQCAVSSSLACAIKGTSIRCR